MPKVSVIVPVYNVEKYLSKCLDSIVNQSLKDIEIICVNDGSTDNSLKILEEYANKDNRIKIVSQANKGLSATRNVGIKHATAEYVGFVDSDDYIDENFYQSLYVNACKFNADIAVAGIKKCTQTKTKSIVTIKKLRRTNKDINKFNWIKVPKYNYVWNKIYRKDMLLKSNVLFEDGVKFEDVMFTHKIIHYCNYIVTVPGVFYKYRVDNPTSITNEYAGSISNDIRKEFNKALKFVISNNIKLKKWDRYFWDKDVIFSIFNMPLFHYRVTTNCTQLCLLKNIVLWEKRTIDIKQY